MSRREVHPFAPFVPENATVLILGSFPGREVTSAENKDDLWFYSAKRNQFWQIISEVYNTDLKTKTDKQKLFSKAGIGITDIFLEVTRENESNLDQHLKEQKYNDVAIRDILQKSTINKIFFTSKFVESHFFKKFPEVKFAEYLPSPSPRYAKMSKAAKIEAYRGKLPQL